MSSRTSSGKIVRAANIMLGLYMTVVALLEMLISIIGVSERARAECVARLGQWWSWIAPKNGQGFKKMTNRLHVHRSGGNLNEKGRCMKTREECQEQGW